MGNKIKLRPYQEKILKELNPLASSALYMATGTGKTITSLEKFKDLSPSKLLVICPHSVIEQWKDVITDQLPDLPIIDFKKSWSAKRKNQELYDERYTYSVIVINFEIVQKLSNLNTIINDDWMIIVDEIHRIKSWGTKKKPVIATHAICKLGDNTPYKMGLTATPTQGRQGGFIDYYPQLLFLGYTDLSYDEFFDKHVRWETKKYNGYYVREIKDYKNTGEIHNVLEIMAKRYVPKYKDFEPQHNKIYVEAPKSYKKLVTEKAIIKNEEEAILLNNSARKRIGLKTMATGTVLGRDAFSQRVIYNDNTVKLDWLEDFLMDTDEVVAVFYNYNVELDNLVKLGNKLGKKMITINGKTKNKYAEINRKDYNLVVGQFQAMSESLDGLHLRCHISVFLSMPESSLVYKQAIGRIDRIGQEKVPMYYYLIMKGTIDENIMEMIEKKIEFSELTLERLEV